MKCAALLSLALYALSCAALAQGNSSSTKQGQAVVAFEVIDTTRPENPTLLTSGTLLSPIDDAIVLTPVAASDFSRPQVGNASASMTRERPYLVHRFNKGTDVVGEREIQGKAVEGTRASARVAQVRNEALSGVLTLDIRQIVAIGRFDNGEVVAELPDIRQRTFSVPLREGSQSTQVGQYKVNTTTTRQAIKRAPKSKQRHIGQVGERVKVANKNAMALANIKKE